MKPYGFKIISELDEREFTFTNRDWLLLTYFGGFSNLSACFKNLIGFNALEFDIGKKKYSVYVQRSKGYFENQLLAVKHCYEHEVNDLTIDFSALIAGSGESPVKRLHGFEYLNHMATVSCEPGMCTLSAHEAGNDGAMREIALVDLRRFKGFEVDNGKIIRIRRKQKESEIGDFLLEVSEFVSKLESEIFKIELIGGDS